MTPLPAKPKNKFAKERFSLGLDIGSSTVKLVKLRFCKDTVELCDFALEPASLDLAPLVKKITEAQGINRVNLSVSGTSTVIRYVNFPRMSEEELAQALKFEAQKHIPFSLDSVNLDSSILKEELPDNKMLIIIAAVKKDLLGQRLKVIEDAGLKPNIVDIDSLALVNDFNFNHHQESDAFKNKAVALVNIGASQSNLSILESGIPRLSRDIFIAGNSFTQKIADTLTLELKAAEALKLNPDKERLDKITAAVEAGVANLGAEIRTSFDYYESQSASSVVKIFLSVGSSNFPGLKDMLANLLSIEVEAWDPFKKIGVYANIDSEKVKARSAELAVAVGLALR